MDSLAECTYYDRTAGCDVVDRAWKSSLILTNKTVLNAEILSQLPQLCYIGILATGHNVIDLRKARERGIVVSSVPGYSTPSVAQVVFALLLELTHRTGHHSRARA